MMTHTNQPAIGLQITEVGKTFNNCENSTDVQALDGITLTIKIGEIIVLVGPSGSGKTTLLNIIAGLDTPTVGHVELGEYLSVLGKASIGYVFQQDVLLPWRTVLQNILLGAEVQHILTDEIRDLAKEYCVKYGLAGFEDSYPSELSEGMRHKAAFIRTVICKPRLLLLDEPFAALDYEVKLFLEQETVRIVRETNTTVIFVTHDIEEAISIANRIVVFTGRPGKIKSIYTIDFGQAAIDPLEARKHPHSRDYFRDLVNDIKYLSLPASP